MKYSIPRSLVLDFLVVVHPEELVMEIQPESGNSHERKSQITGILVNFVESISESKTSGKVYHLVE